MKLFNTSLFFSAQTPSRVSCDKWGGVRDNKNFSEEDSSSVSFRDTSDVGVRYAGIGGVLFSWDKFIYHN